MDANTRRGAPVEAVITALVTGQACENYIQQKSSDGSVVVDILKDSKLACACAQKGLALDPNEDMVTIYMSVPSLVELCQTRGIDPSSFQDIDGPRFQFYPNGKNPLGRKGVHVATMPGNDLAALISKIVSERLGFMVTVTIEHLPAMADVLDAA